MTRKPSLLHCFPVELLEQRFLFDTTLDISGVQPAAFDQPRVHELLRTSPTSDPLLGDDGFGDTSFDVQAFLDTGTSGNILSQETTEALGITNSTYGNPPEDVVYNDVGVAGDQPFYVSNPLYANYAPFSPVIDGSDESTFNESAGPMKFQLNPTPVDDPFLSDPVDIVGMPAIDGKVMVMDPKPTDNIDYMNTYLYAPGTPYNSATADSDPGIPSTSYHVKLSLADFGRFTSVFPDNAPGPTLTGNPMIGPDPVAQLDGSPPDSTPPVTIDNSIFETTGSFLLDTGSAASFISQDVAGRVGVQYAPDSYLSDNPVLVGEDGQPLDNQFTLAIGGTGGAVTVSGFFLDSLTLQTQEGVPIRFVGAPVLVLDVSLQDPNTGQSFVLDGDFGMNYVVASANIDSEGNISAASAAPFDWVTYDQPAGLLGFEPASGGVFGFAPQVYAQYVFYNNSIFDNFQPSANSNDDFAIAPDKSPLLPGDTATINNYTSYTKGINGVMVDMLFENDPEGISAADFSFKVGNDNNPANWQTLTVQPTVTLREFEGTDFTDRFELTWPDNTITNEWLQVKVLANDTTGLTTADVFYFGNAPGESGNSDTDAGVNVMDVLGARGRESVNTVDITNPWDYNRDGFINNDDVLAARGNQTSGAGVLSLIQPPATAAQSVLASAMREHLKPGSLRPLEEQLIASPDTADSSQASTDGPTATAPLQTQTTATIQNGAATPVPGVLLIAAGMSTAGSLQSTQPAAGGELFSQVPVSLRRDALQSPLWLERRLPLRHHTVTAPQPFNDGSSGVLTKSGIVALY